MEEIVGKESISLYSLQVFNIMSFFCMGGTAYKARCGWEQGTPQPYLAGYAMPSLQKPVMFA